MVTACATRFKVCELRRGGPPIVVTVFLHRRGGHACQLGDFAYGTADLE